MTQGTERTAQTSADTGILPASARRDMQGSQRPRFRPADVFGLRRIGAVYVLIGISLIFSFWAPATFPHWATVQQVLNGNAVTALISLALVVPLSAGVFDLSVTYTVSLSGVVAAYLLVHGVPLGLAIIAAMGVALAVGLVNAVVVVVSHIDSFIGTLATGSLIQALIAMISSNNDINGPQLGDAFSRIAQTGIAGFSLPVLYAIVVALVIWYLLEHTALGRRIYASGFNSNAARLAGIRVSKLQFWALVSSSVVAGASGIVLGSQLSSGSPTAGTPYLLPGFAAVFLGATQLKQGRFNAWGTVIAVVLLGVGVTGLGLANAPAWSSSMFTGVVLIAALAVTGQQRRRAALGWSLPQRIAALLRRPNASSNT